MILLIQKQSCNCVKIELDLSFKISGSEMEYIYLIKVAPVSLLLHSLFSQVDLFLRDSLVTSSTYTYLYRAYIETLMINGREAKDSQPLPCGKKIVLGKCLYTPLPLVINTERR